MPITTDHEILTDDGWKSYNDIERIRPGPDGKPIGENEKIASLNISNSTIIIDQFVGELYLSKKDRVMYNIKNDYIDTIVEEDTKFPYKFNLEDNISINSLVKIIYNMTANSLDKFYLITNNSNPTFIEINKNDLIRNIINTDIFTFITNEQTYYVRRNNLEFWTSF